MKNVKSIDMLSTKTQDMYHDKTDTAGSASVRVDTFQC